MTPSEVVSLTMKAAIMTQTPPQRSIMNWRLRGPNSSHAGPTMKRMKMVEPTEAMLTVQPSALERPICGLMTGISGAKANHDTKARKKEIHEKWNERMTGRWHDMIL